MIGTRQGCISTAIALAIAFSGCAAMRRHEARENDNLLTAAGFKMKLADTPSRVDDLATMPPLKMVAQDKNGHVVYRYADPYSCKCLYVGDEGAYARYKRLGLEQKIADERLAAARANEAAAMNWGLWGPW